MKCNHKLGKVEKDGYQYCKECGTAVAAPKVDCEHKWAAIYSWTLSNPLNLSPSGMVYHDRCQKCGDLRRTALSV